MSQRKYNKEELEEAVKNSLSIAEVLRHLNIIPAGGNYFTIKRYIKLWNIDTSHFTGKLWNKGKHTICNPAKHSSAFSKSCISDPFPYKKQILCSEYSP